MRIGITCYPTYGGSGVVATELGIELAARGHEVHFISYAPPTRLSLDGERLHFHEVEVVTYPLFDHPPYTLALATKMLEVFESESLDLLHVHYAIPHSVSALLARSMAAPRGLPFITTLHGTDITLVGSNRSYLPITKFSIEQSDGVTSISRYLLGKTLKEFDIKRPIEVIPNFVNCDLYSRAADKGLAAHWAPNGEPILMHLSNFRPVIGTNAGGMPEVVEHGVDGYLVAPGDVQAAARYAIQILSRPDRGREMGKAARVDAKKKFCANDVIPAYEAYYKRILSEA